MAGFLLLTMGYAALAVDSDTGSPSGTVSTAKDIPLLTPFYPDGTSHFQATINPLVVQRAPDLTGALADSADEDVDFGWHLPFLSLFTIGYDTGINAFRQDQTIWDDEEATSIVTTALINKGSVAVQSGSSINVTPYVQEQRSFTSGLPGYTDATKYGADAAWTPVKDVTTVKVDASAQQTYNFNHSFLDEDLYTTSLDQKLPWLPLTLHTAGSLTQDTDPLLAANDKNDAIIDASLLWKIIPSTSASTGLQRQKADTPASVQLANTDVYFTQLSLQTSHTVIVTVRAAHEQTDTTQAGQFLSTNSDVLLTLGVTWDLGDSFNLGAGLNYRTFDSATPSPAINTPPATVSVSAGGKF